MTTLPPYSLRESREIDGVQCWRCSKCRTWKPEDRFSPNKFTRCGRQSHCHECKNAYHKVLRAKQRARKAQKRAVEKAFTKTAPTYPKPVKTHQKPNTRQRKAIPKVSAKRKSQNQEYSRLRKQFLEEHPICQFQGCREPSTECHHKRGREGRWLTDVTEFMAVCRPHHDWIEVNREEASRLQYLKLRLTTDQLNHVQEHLPEELA